MKNVVDATDFKSWYTGKVTTWDDSACLRGYEETFYNEKKRFWPQSNGGIETRVGVGVTLYPSRRLVALFRTCGEGSVKWSGLESVLGLWSDSYFPLSDLSGLRRGGAAAKGLVTAQFVGGNLRRICVLCLFGDGEVEGGCNRGESVLLDSLCVCLWLSFDGSSMATRRSLDAPPLFQSSCSRRPVKFHSDSLATASLEELSLLLFIVVTIRWLRGCFVSGQGTGPLVLKGHGCVGGARESFTVSESASRQSSHPGAVVFYGGVVDFLAGFWDYFLGRGGGDHPSLYRLMAEASAYSIWEEVQASCGASFIPALVAFARHCYSGNVKGTPGIRGNEENLTFPRVTLMVENSYRYRRISKNNLTECVGFSGWAKLGHQRPKMQLARIVRLLNDYFRRDQYFKILT
ncbi:hypothetical protein F2Q70_00027021 [Brassica cretica]|uniref:Uncharacterized protein n=1 Tax=Brassica cretica TaxID=69181 RepID=A0A8S9L6M2_BRACR|nr:hypothetical protein F2Q70_00027021 [Brassica cretica]